LHFEVSVGGYPVDPQKVIETAQYVQQTQNQFR
jgi:murein DD-endopeptidase MepM/ murein hydrolase activator NlpD